VARTLIMVVLDRQQRFFKLVKESGLTSGFAASCVAASYGTVVEIMGFDLGSFQGASAVNRAFIIAFFVTIAHVQLVGDEDKFARLIQFCRASYEDEMKEVLNDALVAVPSADSELDKLKGGTESLRKKTLSDCLYARLAVAYTHLKIFPRGMLAPLNVSDMHLAFRQGVHLQNYPNLWSLATYELTRNKEELNVGGKSGNHLSYNSDEHVLLVGAGWVNAENNVTVLFHAVLASVLFQIGMTERGGNVQHGLVPGRLGRYFGTLLGVSFILAKSGPVKRESRTSDEYLSCYFRGFKELMYRVVQETDVHFDIICEKLSNDKDFFPRDEPPRGGKGNEFGKGGRGGGGGRGRGDYFDSAGDGNRKSQYACADFYFNRICRNGGERKCPYSHVVGATLAPGYDAANDPLYGSFHTPTVGPVAGPNLNTAIVPLPPPVSALNNLTLGNVPHNVQQQLVNAYRVSQARGRGRGRRGR